MPTSSTPSKKSTVHPMVQPLVFGAVAGIVCAVILVGALLFAFSQLKVSVPAGTPAKIDTPVKSSDEGNIEVVPTATITFTPKPTAKPQPKTDSTTPSGSCDKYKSGAASSVTVKLVPDSGSMTGSTVVRLKPGGNCPGSTGAQEQWLSEGEREKTFGNMSPGTYLIEVANGNYQGVIRQTITVEGNRSYVFTVQVRG